MLLYREAEAMEKRIHVLLVVGLLILGFLLGFCLTAHQRTFRAQTPFENAYPENGLEYLSAGFVVERQEDQ